MVVPPNNGGGTTSTLEIRDEKLFNSNFEVIGAYKFPTLFCIKGQQSVNKNLEVLGCESVVKVLSVLLYF